MKNKNIVIIASTPRAGSTLLKALLGMSEEVSHLPEINFQKFKSKEEIYKRSKKDIIVLKKPAWLYEIGSYPKIPFKGVKKIILFREPFDNIASMKKMVLGKRFYFLGFFLNSWFVKWYWYRVYSNLLERFKNDKDAVFVKYGDLINNPKKITKKLFDFMGTSMKEGVESYRPPSEGWKWGQDDESPYIKSLKVQKKKKHEDKFLEKAVNKDKNVKKLIDAYNKICV